MSTLTTDAHPPEAAPAAVSARTPVITPPRSRPQPFATRSFFSILAALSSPALKLLPFLLPLALLLLWALASQQQWLPAQILPAPQQVARTLLELWEEGELAAALIISAQRLAWGCALGGIIGLGLGSLLACHAKARQALEPLLRGLFAIPTIGWIPILILIFGVEEALKILIIAKAVAVPITLHTSEGLRQVPQHLQEVGEVLRLPPGTRFFRLTLPAALPTIASGLRLGLSAAFIALIVVEMLAATEGIGYMMVWGRTLFQLDVVLAGMVVVGLLGYALDAVLHRATKSLQRWEHHED